MTYRKELKKVVFSWDDQTKLLLIVSNGRDTIYSVTLNKSEAGALQRFIFSMMQFHSYPRKKKTSNTLEDEK